MRPQREHAPSSRWWRAATVTAVAAATVLLPAAVSAAQASTYDLVVSAVQPAAVPGVQASGSVLTFAATIKNVGRAPTPSGVVHGVGFSVDGTLVSWSDYSTASLRPGESRSLGANYGPAGRAGWVATTGRHVVTAVVDDVDRIPHEGDEGNNSRQVVLRVAPVKPVVGLTAVQGLTQEQFDSTHGQDVVVSWTVPTGQPVGTRYAVVEHSEVGGSNLCTTGPDTVVATTTATSVATVISTGHYCYSHTYGDRVRYSVESLAGRSAAAAASGACDWRHVTDSQTGDQRWTFSCDDGPTLNDVCARVDCPHEAVALEPSRR